MPGFLANHQLGYCVKLKYGSNVIGRLNCDINLQDNEVEQQHAVIQYHPDSDLFTIQDLNTPFGVHLNNSSIRNSQATLQNGDVLLFSPNGYALSFYLAESAEDLPVYGHGVDRTEYLSRMETGTVSERHRESSSLPAISQAPQLPPTPWIPASSNTWATKTQSGAWTQIAPIPPPKPPGVSGSLKPGRPSSANSVHRLRQGLTPVNSPIQQFNLDQTDVRRDSEIDSLRQTVNQLSSIITNMQNNGSNAPSESGDGSGIMRVAGRLSNQGSRNGSRQSSVLNETFNFVEEEEAHSGSRNHTPAGSVHSNSSRDIMRVQMDDLTRENQNLREQVEILLKNRSQSPMAPRPPSNSSRPPSGASAAAAVRAGASSSEALISRLDQMSSENVSLQEQLSATQNELEEMKSSSEAKDRLIQSEALKLSDALTKITELEAERSSLKLENIELKSTGTINEDALAQLRREIDEMNGAMKAQEWEAEQSVNMEIEQLKTELSTAHEKCASLEAELLQKFEEIQQLSDGKKAATEESEQLSTKNSELLALLRENLEVEGDADVGAIKEKLHVLKEASQEEFEARVTRYEEQLAEQHRTNESMKTGASNLTDTMRSLDNGNGDTVPVESLRSTLSEVELQDESIRQLQETLVNLLEKLQPPVSQILLDFMSGHGCDLLHANEDDLKRVVDSLNARLETPIPDADAIKAELEAAHQEALEEAVKAVTEQKDQEIEETRRGLTEQLVATSENLSNEIQMIKEEKQALADELGEKISKSEQELAEVKTGFEASSNEISELKTKIEELEASNTELTEKSNLLEDSLAAKEKELSDLQESSSEKYDSEMAILRMESQQHAKTIVSLETKIIALSRENEANIEAKDRAEREKQEMIIKYTRPKPEVPPKPTKVAPVRTMEDLYSMEQLVILLRSELAESKKTLHENEVTIEGLKRDLVGANARLADIAGELSEEQKEEVEKMKSLTEDVQHQLNAVKVQLQETLDSNKRLQEEKERFKEDFRNAKDLMTQLQNELEMKESRISELSRLLAAQKDTNERQLAIQSEQTRIAEELSGLGAQCKGERHAQVMQRQKEALTDLRHRIKLLEQNRPPIPSADQALGQVAILQRELAELRAQQNLGPPSSRDLPGLDVEEEDFMDPETGEVKPGRGKIEQALLKSNRVENAEALELSERSYFSLTKAISRRMEIEKMKGNRTMAHISREEREKLFVDREKDIEMVSSEINALYSRVERKDELLNTYEKDLQRLREMETVAASKQEELLRLGAELRAKKEEVEYVREALRRAKEDYEREKRLNAAIKTNKGDFLDQFEKNRSGWPKHKCEPEDIMGKEKQKKREENEKLKKKTLEIQRLKDLLKEKETQIADLSVKVVNYESVAEVS